MAYEAQTQTAILTRMLDASPSNMDKRQGSVTYDLLSPASIELAMAYIELEQVLKLGFADTSYGIYLDLRCKELGLTRKPAVKAVGDITFTGPEDTFIPKGTEVSTGGKIPVYFKTMADCRLTGGSATVGAEAKTGGFSGNVTIGAIKLLFGAYSGVVSVTNTSTFNGGVDLETDEDLLNRYMERVRRPAASGNANQYRQWALEIAGISDAKVYPLWNGNGTVKIALLDSNKRAPLPSKVAQVNQYIASVAPVGAAITVVAATEVPIHVSGTYTLKPGATLEDARRQIAEGVANYLKTLAFSDAIVRYTQIANVVLDTDAVVDYANLQVNSGTANLTIESGSVAVLGTVN
ncbi:baseplate J/gp47 family protein [Paenibacillus rigui]|uniref:Baseplate J protein n=1 Tax=Paenibacillus rigui TaxID=554312 RepID=A0A229UTH1_9BACL|nr:baseplate J/gp47 family protein [Paenibacillus rigui]OXM86455.1 baseplate J protein [Paenibacillus rigui]